MNTGIFKEATYGDTYLLNNDNLATFLGKMSFDDTYKLIEREEDRFIYVDNQGKNVGTYDDPSAYSQKVDVIGKHEETEDIIDTFSDIEVLESIYYQMQTPIERRHHDRDFNKCIIKLGDYIKRLKENQ